MPEPLPNVISRKKLQYRAQATPFLYDAVFVYDLARTAMMPPSARKYPMDRQRRNTTVFAGTFRISRNPSAKLSRKNTTRITAIKITTATFHHFLFFTVKLFHLTSFQYSLLFFIHSLLWLTSSAWLIPLTGQIFSGSGVLLPVLRFDVDSSGTFR